VRSRAWAAGCAPAGGGSRGEPNRVHFEGFFNGKIEALVYAGPDKIALLAWDFSPGIGGEQVTTSRATDGTAAPGMRRTGP